MEIELFFRNNRIRSKILVAYRSAAQDSLLCVAKNTDTSVDSRPSKYQKFIVVLIGATQKIRSRLPKNVNPDVTVQRNSGANENWETTVRVRKKET